MGSCAAGQTPTACSLIQVTNAADNVDGEYFRTGSCNGKPVFQSFGNAQNKQVQYYSGTWRVVALDAACDETSGWMYIHDTSPLPDMISSGWSVWLSSTWTLLPGAKFTCYGAWAQLVDFTELFACTRRKPRVMSIASD